MLHPRIIVAKNSEEVGKLATDKFEAEIQMKPVCVLGLATGSTPLPLYRELIAREKAGKIDFSKVRSANLEEYKGLAQGIDAMCKAYEEKLKSGAALNCRYLHRFFSYTST